MKHLSYVEKTSDVLFTDHRKVYYSDENEDVFVKEYYANPSLEIILEGGGYNDLSLIPLRAKKRGVNGEIVWSHNLASDIATIDGTTLRFLKHYEGSVTIIATAGGYSDVKVVTINCSAVPDEVIYSVVTPPSTPTVEWDATSAELSFVGKITAKYTSHEGRPDESTQSTYTFTAEFPQNPLIYPEVNTEMVDLGLPSGTKWAKCNLYAQTETDYGYYFQWGDTIGYPTAGVTTINREGVYNWEGNDIAWIVKQKNDGKIFTYNTTPYQTNESAAFTDSATKWSKYVGSTTSSYKDPSATDEDALKTVLDPKDDAAYVHMGEGWRMPTEAQFNELLNGTTNAWVTDYNGSGINGLLFTSKTNGNTLFIPAAGEGYDQRITRVGTYGYVWSNNINISSPYGINELNFNKDYWGMYQYGAGRYLGFSIRGVHA